MIGLAIGVSVTALAVSGLVAMAMYVSWSEDWYEQHGDCIND